ncbi:MAG: hypothetical protein BWZ10_01089 [candidate division BRC1 bacterium ADurb.BinA364]|nr:MAG: hypothetical protein BWZ10_01089 [candidate division BRC1 bacterium ADurb.BinA364]
MPARDDHHDRRAGAIARPGRREHPHRDACVAARFRWNARQFAAHRPAALGERRSAGFGIDSLVERLILTRLIGGRTELLGQRQGGPAVRFAIGLRQRARQAQRKNGSRGDPSCFHAAPPFAITRIPGLKAGRFRIAQLLVFYTTIRDRIGKKKRGAAGQTKPNRRRSEEACRSRPGPADGSHIFAGPGAAGIQANAESDVRLP